MWPEGRGAGGAPERAGAGQLRDGEETVFGGVRPGALIERLLIGPVAASIAALGKDSFE